MTTRRKSDDEQFVEIVSETIETVSPLSVVVDVAALLSGGMDAAEVLDLVASLRSVLAVKPS